MAVRGQWFTQSELDALVDEFVATYLVDVSVYDRNSKIWGTLQTAFGKK
jgi:hypothetical protein